MISRHHVLALLLVASTTSAQTTPAWISEQYGYIANNESLRSLLFGFGVTVDVPVIVSDEINLVVDGSVPIRPAGDFLDYLNAEFQVIWMYDGTTLFFYDIQELATESVPLPAFQRRAFEDTLKAIGILGRPLQWTFLPAANLLQVSGPPRYIELIKEITRNLEDSGVIDDVASEDNPSSAVWKSMATMDEEFAIRIFKIDHGFVGEDYSTINLAEMIAQLMNVSHRSASTEEKPIRRVAKLKGEGVMADEGEEAEGPPSIGLRASGQEAFVLGDPRLNAIIVRDLKHRMSTYEKLISQLDVAVDQVKIGVSVLDVDSSEGEEWSFGIESSDFLFTNNPGEVASNISFVRNQFEVDGIALRLRALQESGRSRLLTQPSIVTLDNQEASFRNDRTFYVRLGGERSESVDLAPVSYGWVVRIRPHVIYQGDGRRIQLSVHLEDGARGGAALAVTGVPEVAQNVIQTKAVIQEGNSLVVGGYTVREQTSFDQRMPFVGRVPIVGRLVSGRNDRERAVARYFLITPRVLPATIHHQLDAQFDSHLELGLPELTPITRGREK